ncbi:unnamed protein product [Heligmosomoides polygyrus]|uniref:Pre-mRNA-splicing factor SYF2 n=1 Tax=Heligmosomoides polygyrus TaxID=6339 RepID=A0A183G669_HELPZ|nr:unnamed protein product [Heligmosomoides polygyrus]
MGDSSADDKPGSSSSSKPSVDFNQRFRKLHQLRQQCRKANHEQVVEEDRRKKLPKNYEARKARDEWELQEMEERKVFPSDPGYEDMTLRQHTRLTTAIKPDIESYKKMREIVGVDQFYPTANTLIQGSHYPTSAAMEKISTDVVGQAKRREQFHRRRMFDPDAPVDYINDKNMRFNKKLEKFYGQYTEDIREDLERGTAI